MPKLTKSFSFLAVNHHVGCLLPQGSQAFCEKRIHVFYPLDFLLCQKEEKGKSNAFPNPLNFASMKPWVILLKNEWPPKNCERFGLLDSHLRGPWWATIRCPRKGWAIFFPVSFSHQIVNFLPCGPTVRDSLGRSYYTNWSLTCLTYVYRSAASFWDLTGGNQPPKQTNKW